MPMIAIAAAGLAVAAVGTVASISAQNKANKLSQQANKFERQKTELQSARQKTQAIRETRAAYGQTMQGAENQGASNTSVAAGAAGSVQSQGFGNLSFLDQYGFLSDQASKSMGAAQSAQNTAGMWGQVADLGFKAYSMSGGLKGAPKIPGK